VDFADTDAGGVVYFGSYGRFLERAAIAYRRADHACRPGT
jgi:acyl-CoA thioesterase FadM